MPKKRTYIIIPCYNEEKRLPLPSYRQFLAEKTDTIICFVDDGSKDGTLSLLQKLKIDFPSQIEIVTSQKNVGKAEAVRQGMLYCLNMPDCNIIGYLDSDLATSFEAFLSLRSKIQGDVQLCFGSRKKDKSNFIKRNLFRHWIGRIIAFIIQRILKMNIYDTQCGCKIFTKSLALQVFHQPFITRWLFDVEIFTRIRNTFGTQKFKDMILEITLEKWEDVGESKVSTLYFFRLWKDLLNIHKTYNLKK